MDIAKQKQFLSDKGYTGYVTREGVLTDDELWIHPETIKAYNNGTPNPKYIFVFKEKYLNDWSSTQTMRRYRKLPKNAVKFLEKLCIV